MQLGTVVGGFALSALTLIASSARAAPVAIVNPGFETVSRTLADGEQTNGLGGDDILVGTRSPFPFGDGVVDWSDPVTAPGWRTQTVPFGSAAEVFAGVLRPAAIGGTPFISGIEGDHALAIQAAVAGQMTEEVLQPGATYTLSFLGGISQFDSDYFFAVSLTAIDASAELPVENEPGVTRLEIGRFFPPSNVPDGVMRRYEFSYTAPEDLGALDGARIGICVFGSDGIPRVVYDDFTLRVGDATDPADLDADGEVGASDLAILLAAWGVNAGSAADFNGDGAVDSGDLAVLLAGWGG